MRRDDRQNPAAPIGHTAIWRRRLALVCTIAVALSSAFVSGCAASPPPKVHFIEGGSPGAHIGTDTRDPKDDAHFTWHGLGWLSFVSSDWYVSQIARDGSWAVIPHDSTIGTPAASRGVASE